jgi:hypothetical protein
MFDLIGKLTTPNFIDIKEDFVAQILKLRLQLARYA